MKDPNYFNEFCEEVNDWCGEDKEKRAAFLFIADGGVMKGLLRGYHAPLAEALAQFFFINPSGASIFDLVLDRLAELNNERHDS